MEKRGFILGGLAPPISHLIEGRGTPRAVHVNEALSPVLRTVSVSEELRTRGSKESHLEGGEAISIKIEFLKNELH